ncbi:MAG: SulP family inorganic anion transporter [Acidimicrobiia bacterium]|nr:SulP family inorganic anion transporter [Acidimicrobiia bacterium]
MPILSLLPQRTDYSLRHFRSDFLAGLTVAIVALPLALGFGVTSGAGAASGVITAIVAGIVAAIFGGSNFQVSGPTGAMTVVLLPVVARYGVAALGLVGIMAGMVLLVMAAARVGRYVQYIPWPVIAGFTNGIAVIIFLQQLPGALGVEKGTGSSVLIVTGRTLSKFVESPQAPAIIVALVTVAVMWSWLRVPRLRVVPASLVALLVGTAVSLVPYFDNVERLSGVPRGLPMPQLPSISIDQFTDLFRAALAVAVLAALESLLSAVVADGMTIEERHDPDRELFGQGLANIASSLFGGMPATGALARTAVNVRSGARTRLAAVLHGVLIMVIVLFLAPLASSIPLAVLAGILMVVAVRMAESEAVRIIFRSTKSDAFVLVLTMVVTVVFDLILAIEVGMVAAGILFIIRMSNLLSIDSEPLGTELGVRHDTETEIAEEEHLLHESVIAYRIDGPVFFGAANRFFDQLLKVGPSAKVVILRMRTVPVMDATGLGALESLVERLANRHILVFVSGLQPQPLDLLTRTGVLDKISRDRHHVFATTEEAIIHARSHAGSDDHTSPTR